MSEGSVPGTARHTPFSVVAAYEAQSLGGVFDVAGTPRARVQISPQARVITLLVEATDKVVGPELRDLANLDYCLRDDAGSMWHRLDVTYDQNLAEVYPVLCTILDHVQVDGKTFREAVKSVLAGLGDILSGRGGLSREQQVGLFGELLVLLSLAEDLTPLNAVAAWRGPDREEHDFGIVNGDVEVKTTTSERRSHWISSFTQLLPTVGRKLHLLSLQITVSGSGSGMSLAELVDALRSLPGVPLGELDKSLEAAGYLHRHADLYRARWTLRTVPEFYLVDDGFPVLTMDRVKEKVPNADRIKDVRYRVELDGLAVASPLFDVTLKGALPS